MKFIKQERLSPADAEQDMEQIKESAKKVGIQNLDDVKSTADFRALREMLRDEALYSEPEIEDTIILGRDQIQRLQRITLEKPSLEVHYQRQAHDFVQQIGVERFGLAAAPLPIERIFYLSNSDLQAQDSPLSDPGKLLGQYDPENKIILIEFENKTSFAHRLHAVIHELVHHLLEANKNKNENFNLLRRQLTEGITEQMALEISAPLISNDELFPLVEQWLRDSGYSFNVSGKDSFNNHLPKLPPKIDPVNRDDLFFLYSYPKKRLALYLLSKKFLDVCREKNYQTELTALEKDSLKIFVDFLTGKDPRIFVKLLRASIGNGNFEKVKAGKISLEEIVDLI